MEGGGEGRMVICGQEGVQEFKEDFKKGKEEQKDEKDRKIVVIVNNQVADEIATDLDTVVTEIFLGHRAELQGKMTLISTKSSKGINNKVYQFTNNYEKD